MSADQLFVLAGAALIALSLGVLVSVSHLLRKLLALNVLASGVFLVLVALGRTGGAADAVPQALVLTGIVVAFASTALALALLRRWFSASGHLSFEDAEAPETQERRRP